MQATRGGQRARESLPKALVPVKAPVWETHSVVEGDERSVTTLPCRLSCCSLGEDGSESLISSISSCADCDLVFFLLNACLKELRSCKTQRNKKQSVNAVSDTGVMLFLRIKKKGGSGGSTSSRSGSHAELLPSSGHFFFVWGGRGRRKAWL